MRQYCLNKDELSRFIDVEIEGGQLYEEDLVLGSLLYSWRNWDIELVCFATLLSHLLERKQKQSKDAITLLKSMYNIPEEKGLGLIFEQVDERFVGYMLKFIRRKELSIEEDLIDIRHQFGEYNYRIFK